MIQNFLVIYTVAGNDSNSHKNCPVPYANTELVLSCGSQLLGIIWRKDDCIGGQFLGEGNNYTVNGNPDMYRRLTNDDSGTYCCKVIIVPDGGWEYRYVNVNVLGKCMERLCHGVVSHARLSGVGDYSHGVQHTVEFLQSGYDVNIVTSLRSWQA